ncbi:MAG TPA: AraC family transcriptional regulator [Blastocatellia bacterium]|nr:AraC family transcriptional regulator [Blastocatellia bacterium]
MSVGEFQPHSHAALSVTLLVAGRMDVRIGEQDYSLSAGQIALTNVGEVHSGRAEAAEFVTAGISPGMFDQILSGDDSQQVPRTGAELKIEAVVISDKGIQEILREMRIELGTDRLGRGQMLESMGRQIAIQLVRSHITVRKAPQIELSRVGPVDRRLRRAIEFMHDNFARELGVEEIASAAFLSEYHFARLFKQITGITPHSYLASIRLERARELLLQTPMAISEIALTVGYQTQSHFTHAFKSATGVTPLAYRRGRVDPRSESQGTTS